MAHSNPSPGLNQTIIATVLRQAITLLLKPALAPHVPVPLQRRWLAGLMRSSTLPARGVAIETATLGGVPGEWLTQHDKHDTPTSSPGTILYLHGGAYCIGSPATHRALTSRLCKKTNLPVFSLDYRLAPEHPFPAALEDALAAYHALRSQGPVFLAGDSAGGGLALATTLVLRATGTPLPAALLLISPWVDMSEEDDHNTTTPNDPMLTRSWLRASTALYLGMPRSAQIQRTTLAAPLLSPLKTDLRGLPPTLVQAGTDEMLLRQALGLGEALQRAGVPTRCEITQGHWHVAHMHAGALSSADEALASMARFVASVEANHADTGMHLAKPAFTHTYQATDDAFGYSGAC